MTRINFCNKLVLIVPLLATICITGCTGNFDEVNRNKDQVTREEMARENYIIGSTLKGMQGLVIPTEEHLYQFYEILAGQSFAGYMEATPTWKEKFSTYNPPSNWLAAPFEDVTTKMYPYYRDIYNQTDNAVALAMADVLRVAIMHRVSDTYGPIPYSKVIERTDESLKVGYDSQEQVYTKMFEELDAALAVFEANATLGDVAFQKFDNVYFGNIARWMKFCNSLKLRMAMRLCYVEPLKAQQLAEAAVSGGVITANMDNARLTVEENRAALVFNNWKDHCVGADIITYMNGYKDPRREKMFTKIEGGYYGMRIGIDPVDRDKMILNYSRPVITDKDPFLWMNAAEITFLRAEGALRGWSMGGDAQSLYNDAIKLSFGERGATGAEAYIEDQTSTPLAYVDPLDRYSNPSPRSNITIKWSDEEGKFEQNLERIITQKWIALFPLGIEAWSEFRRTGYPKLLPVVENKSGNTINSDLMIRRLPYPVNEYNENGQNLQQAIGMLNGADNGGTRLWWDVKPFN